jgi:hypothetical protein
MYPFLARSKLEMEGTFNELYTKSKEKQDDLSRSIFLIVEVVGLRYLFFV